MFSLILILGALISFITGASCGIIINWVLDFSQSFLHSNRQRSHTQEVFRLVEREVDDLQIYASGTWERS